MSEDKVSVRKKKKEPILSTDDPRFRSFIMSALRKVSRWWKPLANCKNASRVSRGMYKCSNPSCGKVVRSRDIKVDHIDPVIPISGFTNWDDVIKRLFCDISNFQTICSACHDSKTLLEQTKRKALRKEKAVLQYNKNKRRKTSDPDY